VPDRRDLPGHPPGLTIAPPRRVPSTGGLDLALHDLGGEGRPLLLTHATGFHGRVWGPCAAHLPYRCWAPDLRGHGASPLPAGSFHAAADPDAPPEPDGALLSWDRFADDVLAVVDALDLPAGGLAAVGHSKGGATLLLAEQRRPGTFRALYLYEPVVFPPEIVAARLENPLAAGARRRRRTFPSLAAALANYAAKPPLGALDPAALDAYVRHGFVAAADGSVTLACLPEVEAAIFAQGMTHRAFDHLGEVACPVTVATGRSVPGPALVAPALVEALPRGELVTHPDLGHFGPLEDPGALAADIAARLARW
jgi:pimeloyl-ACP methyl ester carboxylesterase